MIAYDASYGRQTTALAFIVNRPADEPGFRLDRTDANDRAWFRHRRRARSHGGDRTATTATEAQRRRRWIGRSGHA